MRSQPLQNAASDSMTTLCDWLGPVAGGSVVPLRDMHMDSRRVGPGDVFIAVAGEQGDGLDYVNKAVAQGAAAVLVEAVGSAGQFDDLGVPVIVVDGLKGQLGVLAKRFYADADADADADAGMQLIGVTGTNGKTSVTHMLAHLLQGLGQSCAVVGTLGWGFTDSLRDTGMTTPDIVSTHRILARLARTGARYVAMEVSSHGLAQNRIDQVDISAAVFTNLSRDHLDYHGDMASYGASKRSLFLRDMQLAVFNLDDDFGAQLSQDSGIGCDKLSYSLTNNAADVCCSQLRFHSAGCTAVVATPWGQGELHSPLLGRFNLLNLLSCITLLGGLGFDLQSLLRTARSVCSAPGRMELVWESDIRVIVDYAHTPDALEQVLQALRPHVEGHLWLVFGCGGDRDKGKRPLMGELAGRLADRLVLTSDNPRSESPGRIIDDIREGIDAVANTTIEPDRQRAIAYALAGASAGDIVIIAGKGHENYQEINGQRRPFSDRECVEQYYCTGHQAQR